MAARQWCQGVGDARRAAKGSFERLDGPDADVFEAYYVPLRDVLRRHKLDGIDLDVEEYMSVTGVVRLIDRLRVDFGPKFVITMAPVATALLPSQPHLRGSTMGSCRKCEVMRLLGSTLNSTADGAMHLQLSGTMPSCRLGGHRKRS